MNYYTALHTTAKPMTSTKTIPHKNHFSDNLNFVMLKRGFLPADLHRLTGISNSYLGIMLTPQGNASLSKISLVAKALHIPMFTFFLPKDAFRYIVINSEAGHPVTATDALQLIARKYEGLGTDENGCSEKAPT